MVDSNKDYRSVEVGRKTHDETGFFTNAWYPTTIITPCTNNPLKKRKCNHNKEEEQDRSLIGPFTIPPEPNDVVDAWNEEESVWSTGVVLSVQNDYCSVFFKEAPDIKDFHCSKLRPHWEQWLISPKQEIQYSKFKPGTSVELKDDMLGFAWIPATVIGEKGTNSVVVRYDNKNNQAVKITVQLDMIRPKPPQLSNDEDFKLKEKVDAFCESSYWLVGTITSVGKITSTLVQRKYAVNFGTYPKRNEIVFDHSQLRSHLDWVNEQWITNSGEVISTPTQQIQTQQVCDTAAKDIESSCSGSEFNNDENETPCSTNQDDTQNKELLFSATSKNDEEANSPKVNGSSNMLVKRHYDEFDNSGLLSFKEDDRKQNSKREKSKEQYELQAPNSQGNTNEERKNTPFVKRSNLWALLESLEMCQKLPQNPHFHPLLNEEDDEIEFEALALSHMVKFALLIEKVFNLREDGSMAEIDYLIAELTEMGKLGFDVKVVKNNLNEWRMKKVELEELKIQITLHNEKKAKIDEELKILEKKQSLLMSQSAYEASQVSKLIAEATRINEAFSVIMGSSKCQHNQ
ncbi:hypothetical protein CsatA_005519 [Cannabis sativa]